VGVSQQPNASPETPSEAKQSPASPPALPRPFLQKARGCGPAVPSGEANVSVLHHEDFYIQEVANAFVAKGKDALVPVARVHSRSAARDDRERAAGCRGDYTSKMTTLAPYMVTPGSRPCVLKL
jgi:hypothetical protein